MGNANLKRELHKEVEVGVEARFWSNRIGLDLSLYDKQSSDLIIDLNLDPSSGYTNTTVNAAEVSNRGVEASLDISPFRGKFNWDLRLNYTINQNTVDAIAPGIDQVQISGSFDGVAGWAIPGEPYGVLQGTAYRRLNGKRVVNASGDPIPEQDISIIGDPNPEYKMSWINNLSFKGISLGWQWDFTKGGDIYSIYTATMLARGNTKDTDFDRFLPIILGNSVKEDGSPNDIQTYIGDLSFNGYFFANEGGLFDATVIRLREVSLEYEIPASLLEKTPFGKAAIRLSGDNVWHNAPNFPKYVNYDPEVLSTGVGNGRGQEYGTGPTVRKYAVTLNFTF